MMFHENRLPADDSHEISCHICYFRKGGKILNCRLLQIIGGALSVSRGGGGGGGRGRLGFRTPPLVENYMWL